jgi:uncharacterized protein
VVAERDGTPHCGLAATLAVGEHCHTGRPDVPQAGALESLSGRTLAQYALDESPLLTSLGLAAINALLPRMPQSWQDEGAEALISRLGAGRRVALVGHFPFVSRLRAQVEALDVLELQPGPGDLPAEMAPQVLPEADVIAITGMTVSNRTLEDLLRLRSPRACVILLGPSTPLSPVLFDYGVDILSGAVVSAIEPVLRAVSQGANFHQVRAAGVRLVNLARPNQPVV